MADEKEEAEVSEEEVEAAEGADGDAEGDGDAAGKPRKKKRMSGKKMIMLGLPVVLLLAGGGVYMSGMLDSLLGGDEKTEAEKKEAEEGEGAPKTAVFHKVPDLLVNLNAAGGTRRNFLKVSISLELEKSEDVAWIESVMPRIVDNFQVYLRELRVEDLRGSAGLARLREELLHRVNVAAQPIKVSDVLFRQMLIQ